MCGRYTLTVTDPDVIAKAFDLDEKPASVPERYNIAPTQDVPTVVQDSSGTRRLSRMRWGLIPAWAKDRSYASKMINARSETVHEKTSFKEPFRHRRCLVVADGFYEWRKNDDGSKTPMYVCFKDHRLFGLAGIWEKWTDPANGEVLTTFSILTSTPNEVVADLHHRMAVILRRDDYGLWLSDTSDEAALLDALKPHPADEMHAYPVSTRVNSPSHESPELIEPVEA